MTEYQKIVREVAEDIVNFYLLRVYPFGAGSAYLTGTEDPESKLGLAKECAMFHVNSILQFSPSLPTAEELELEESIEFATEFWLEVSNFIKNYEQ